MRGGLALGHIGLPGLPGYKGLSRTSSGGGFSYRLLGLGFWQAWWMIASRTDLVVSGDASWLPFDWVWLAPRNLFTIVTTFGYLAVALCARHLRRPFSSNRSFFVLAAALTSLGTLFLAAMTSLKEPSALVLCAFAVALVMVALGNALTLFMWGELWSSLETARVGRYLFASYLFSFVLYFGLTAIPDALAMVADCLFPTVSVAVLWCSQTEPKRAGVGLDYDWDVSLPIRAAAFLFVVGAAHGFLQPYVASLATGAGSVGVSFVVDVVLMVCLYAFVLLAQPEFEARPLFKAAVSAVVCGMALIMALPHDFAGAGNGIFLFGIHCFDMLIMLVASDIAFRKAIPIAYCFGASIFVERLGTTVANVGYSGLLGIGSVGTAETSAVAFPLFIAMLLVCTILFTEHDFMRLFQPRPAVRQGSERVEERCDAAAETFRFTPREREVLELVLLGRSGPYIAKELVISENTVRNHMSNIYRKVGVYDRQSLLDVVNGVGR